MKPGEENTATRLTRREFLGRTAGLTLAGAAGAPLVSQCGAEQSSAPQRPAPAPAARGLVVRAEKPGLVDERGRIKNDGEAASGLLESVLARLTGRETLTGALKTLFKPGERVGVKLNCLAGRGLSPQPPLVHALVDGLVAAGVKADDVIVFERSERELREAGYPVGRPEGVRFLGNDSPGMGYEAEPRLHKSIGSCFCRILTDEIDALINFGVLKDHNLAGVSVGLKNLFGLIHNPNKYHGDNCDPFVAHVLEAPPVRNKLRLTLADGLTAQYQGGPGLMKKFTWRPGILLASCDPVALDAVGASIIEAQRAKEGLPSLEKDGRAPTFIATAAACGLGEGRLDRIDVITI